VKQKKKQRKTNNKEIADYNKNRDRSKEKRALCDTSTEKQNSIGDK
jgi:hypothetical protein